MVLDLTFMFSGAPYPVHGAKLVKGYAMSGSPVINDIGETEIDRKIKATPKEAPLVRVTKRPMTPAQIRRRYEAAMSGRGWMSTTMVAELAGATKDGVAHHLRKLLINGNIERQRVPAPGKGNNVKYLWRWK